MTFLEIYPLPEQPAIDFAIQVYGTPEGIFMLMADNAEDHFKDQNLPVLDHTKVVKVRSAESDIKVSDVAMMRYFRDSSITVNTMPKL